MKYIRISLVVVAANNGFTLGVRAPGQSFNDCMKANAGNYSMLGVADFALDANGKIADNFWLGFTPASNPVTNVYNSATGSLTSPLQTGPMTVKAGMGTTVTYGRRTSSIMSLNLPGPPGGPKGGSPALGGWRRYRFLISAVSKAETEKEKDVF